MENVDYWAYNDHGNFVIENINIIKPKLSLCLTKQYAMKAYVGVDV
jgi:hypothetical protein